MPRALEETPTQSTPGEKPRPAEKNRVRVLSRGVLEILWSGLAVDAGGIVGAGEGGVDWLLVNLFRFEGDQGSRRARRRPRSPRSLCRPRIALTCDLPPLAREFLFRAPEGAGRRCWRWRRNSRARPALVG
jgi:hypothetical protein